RAEGTLPAGVAVAAVAAALLAMAPAAATASTVIELSVGELATRATAVVAGTPLERRSVWESTGGARTQRIVTYTRVRVERVIVMQGQAPSEVWVRTLGGEVDGIGQQVVGEAVLPMARPTLLFLIARSDGTHGVVGMAQGSYPLESAAAGAAAVRLARPTGLGRVLPRAGATATTASAGTAAARLALPGRTLDDVAQLITSARQATHAP